MRPLGDRHDTGRRQASIARLVPAADLILLVAIVFAVVQLGFTFQLHRPHFFKLLFIGIILFAGTGRRLSSPSARINAALLLVPVFGALLAYQAYALWRRPPPATAAWLAGRTFDSRGVLETVRDEREREPSALPYMIPRGLLTHHLLLEQWEPEEVVRVVKDNWGIVVDGVQTLPLSGVANRRTIFCNEGGAFSIYDSDEHGFNNPHGIWDSGDVQVMILGDSFTHGACVAPDATTAAGIRRQYPRTLNLGMSANGPLMEYAALKEYVAPLRPPIVLWAYYYNDLSDLEVEKDAAVLRRYLEDDQFRQNLANRQVQIDTALAAYLEDLMKRSSPRWPASLRSAGVTRQVTPLWLQDFITRENNSAISQFLRLDGFTWYVTKRFLEENIFHAPPDLELFERILAQSRDTVAAWGGRLYFVYLPAVHYLDGRYRDVPNRDAVLAILERLGIPLIDVHSAFLEQADPEQLRFHYESHANEAGYALHAKTILDGLAQMHATGDAGAVRAPLPLPERK